LVEQLTRARDRPWVARTTFMVSSEVAANLPSEVTARESVIIKDTRPLTWTRWVPRRPRYAVSYVVFGPEYGWPRARRRLVGFADVRSVYPMPSGMTVPR
jgi:hypothetical protein